MNKSADARSRTAAKSPQEKLVNVKRKHNEIDNLGGGANVITYQEAEALVAQCLFQHIPPQDTAAALKSLSKRSKDNESFVTALTDITAAREKAIDVDEVSLLLKQFELLRIYF